MNIVVLDLEFNLFFDFPNTKITQNPRCPSEIIQFGVVKLDENLNFISKKSFLVRPQIYTNMHPYVERLTGLTDEMLEKEACFSEVFESFVRYIGGKKIIFFIWGPDDIKELYKNILFYNGKDHRLSKDYVNVQKMANSFLRHEHSAIGLKTAVDELGINIGLPFHNALNDAIYTAEIFKIITNSKFDLSTLNLQSININHLKQSIIAKTNEINMKPLLDFAQSKFHRKFNEKDKAAILSIYEAGQNRRFDTHIKNPIE